MIEKTGMPKGGRLPLVLTCKLRIHPLTGGMVMVLAAIVLIYFLRRAGFSMMLLAATGRHPSFSSTSSP